MPKIRVECSSIFNGEQTYVKGQTCYVDVDQAKRLVCAGNGTLFVNRKKEDGTLEEVECSFDEAAVALRMNSDDLKTVKRAADDL